MFPDFLYRLDARDEQSAVLGQWQRGGLTQGTGTSQSVDLEPVPADRVVILTNVTAFGIPSALNILTNFQFRLTGQGIDHSFSWRITGAAAAENQVHNWDGYLIVPPGIGVRITGSFDGVGATNHAVQAWGNGIIVPRGNVLEL